MPRSGAGRGHHGSGQAAITSDASSKSSAASESVVQNRRAAISVMVWALLRSENNRPRAAAFLHMRGQLRPFRGRRAGSLAEGRGTPVDGVVGGYMHGLLLFGDRALQRPLGVSTRGVGARQTRENGKKTRRHPGAPDQPDMHMRRPSRHFRHSPCAPHPRSLPRRKGALNGADAPAPANTLRVHRRGTAPLDPRHPVECCHLPFVPGFPAPP